MSTKTVKKMTILGKFAERLKTPILELKPGMNVIIGPNGSGKTSILSAVREQQVIIYPKMRARSLCFDTEKDNPRLHGHLIEGAEMFQLGSHWASHGQTMLPLLLGVQDALKRDDTFALVCVDEPESGLDFKGQEAVIEAWKKLPKDRVQFIVATHSPMFLNAANNVIELDKHYREKIRRAYFMALFAIRGANGKPTVSPNLWGLIPKVPKENKSDEPEKAVQSMSQQSRLPDERRVPRSRKAGKAPRGSGKTSPRRKG